MNSTAIEQAYTPKEAALILRCSRDHVIELIKSGQLAAKNIGRGKRKARYIITAQSLRDFLNPPSKVEPRKRAPPSPRRWV